MDHHILLTFGSNIWITWDHVGSRGIIESLDHRISRSHYSHTTHLQHYYYNEFGT